jgi:hypothetical protein
LQLLKRYASIKQRKNTFLNNMMPSINPLKYLSLRKKHVQNIWNSKRLLKVAFSRKCDSFLSPNLNKKNTPKKLSWAWNLNLLMNQKRSYRISTLKWTIKICMYVIFTFGSLKCYYCRIHKHWFWNLKRNGYQIIGI